MIEALEARALCTVFTVTTVNNTGTGSLRDAITQANANPGPDTIQFSIGVGGVAITPVGALPDVTGPVTIDGTTQPGYAGKPLVRIDGGGSPSNSIGLNIRGGNSTLNALIVSQWGTGIQLDGAGVGAGGNTINNCYIGTTGNGKDPKGNYFSGINILNSPSNAVSNCLVSANGTVFGHAGISVDGSNNNVFIGNIIGLDFTGTVRLSNGGAGIAFFNGSSNNRIGTNGDGVNDAAEGNVISGNTFDGIDIGSGAGYVIAGNIIGTGATGTGAPGTAGLGNGGVGIAIFGGASNVRIGTNGDNVSDAQERNVIAGNRFDGVSIDAGGGNAIAGNYIGLRSSGTAVLANGGAGISLFNGSSNNRIGTNADGVADAGERNVISGNAFDGILIGGGSGNVIAGNYLGADVSGTVGLGNGGSGVSLYGGVTNSRIGTNGDNVNDVAERNVIIANAAQGVAIGGGSGNVVAGNYIGLDAGGVRAVGNVSGGVVLYGGSTSNRIGLNPAHVNAAGERNLISGNNSTGLWLADAGTSFNQVVGNYIGTDVTGKLPRGNAFQGIGLFTGATSNQIVQNVVSANSSGNTFAAIELFGTNITGNVIQGNLIGTDNGGTATLGNGGAGVLIHAGAANNLVGSNFDGLNDAAERNVIAGNGVSGVQIDGLGSNGNTVAGNYIGTDATGKVMMGNTLQGILLSFSASANVIDRNVIVGNSPGTNRFPQIELYGSTTANVIVGNVVGADVTGTNRVVSGGVPVYLHFGSSGNRIGTNGDGVNDAAERNVITGSPDGYPGLELDDVNTTNNLIAGNRIGTDLTGTRAMPNGGPGVFIRLGASNNVIGGPSAAFGNLIVNNGSNYTELGGYHYDDAPGVVITDANSLNNTIRANSIYNNRGLGIDLSALGYFDGVNVNHTTNVAVGPNRLQNYPLILAAAPGTAATAVTGLLTGVPNTNYLVDLYASAAPNVSLFGDGQRYLGAITVNTGATGTVTFNVSIAAATSATEFITATATDPAGNTSEFSAARKLNAAAPVPLSSTAWTPIGPSPISTLGDGVITTGRVADIVPDPSNTNVAYLASDTGGVWKTLDWGDANPVWTPLTDGQSSLDQGLGYHTLAIAPSNTQVLYNAVSGPHGGILKSTNGGSTWTLLAAAQFPEPTFSGIIVNPTDPNTLYVGLRNTSAAAGGVYKSTNGGANWSNVTAATTAADASDVVFDPNDSQTLYAGLVANSASAGVYKSTNAGSTWLKLGTGLLASPNVGQAIRLAVAPSNSQVLYATEFDAGFNVTRYTSTNGGSTWTTMTALPTPNDDRYWHAVLAVDPTNAQVVYANADHELYRSTNGGVTWPVNPFAEDPVNVRFEPVTNAVIITGDRGVYRWGGGAGPVVNKQGNLQNTQNYTITLDPNDERTVYAIAQDQGNVQKFSGLAVWNVTTSGNEVGKVLVNPTNSSRIYDFAAGAGGGGQDAGPADGIVIRSDDGGATWTKRDTGLATNLAQLPQAYTIQKSFVMDPSNPHRLLVGLQGVYETTDDADSWHSISPTAGLSAGHYITYLAVAPSAANTIYAATDDGRLFTTTNNGSLWVERDTGLPIDAFNRVIDLKVDPANPLRAFAVTGADRFGATGSHVWMTTNGGASWTNISSNLDPIVWAQSLAVDWRFASPVLYVGTARGVQTSTVTGTSTTWVELATGLPHVPVEDLELLPNSNLLAAGTYGRGVWEIRVGTPSVFSVASGNHTFIVSRDVDNVNADVTVDGNPVQKVLIAQMSELRFTGGSGNDSLTIDFSHGNPLPAGGVTFDGGTGIDALTVIGTGGNDVLTAGPAGLTFSGGAFSNVPITLANVSKLAMHGGAGLGADTINLASGAWQVDADTPTGTPSVSVVVQPAATATFTSDQHVNDLTIAGGLAKIVAPSRKTVSVLGALSLTGNGTLDVGDGFALLDNTKTSAASVAAAIQRAYNLDAFNGYGAFDGPGGITSTTAVQSVNNLQISVGFIDGSIQTRTGIDLTTGQATNRILVRAALNGDVNLNGVVDGDDIGQIIQLGYFAKNLTPVDGWADGDLNYDGRVDGDDIGLIIQSGNFTTGRVYGSVPAPAPVASAAPAADDAPVVLEQPPLPATTQPTPPVDAAAASHERHLRHVRHVAHLRRLGRARRLNVKHVSVAAATRSR